MREHRRPSPGRPRHRPMQTDVTKRPILPSRRPEPTGPEMPPSEYARVRPREAAHRGDASAVHKPAGAPYAAPPAAAPPPATPVTATPAAAMAPATPTTPTKPISKPKP